MTAKKCDAHAKLLFCQSTPIAFLPFLLLSLIDSPDTDASNFLKAVLQETLMGAQCSEPVKSRVPSMGFL